MADTDFSGWALKQGSNFRTWKRRFFVLRGRSLLYYAGQHASGRGDGEKGRVLVVGVELDDSRTMLLITCDSKAKLLRIKPAAQEDLPVWLAALQRAASGGSSSSPALKPPPRPSPPPPMALARDDGINATNLFGTDLYDEDADPAAFVPRQSAEHVEAYYKSAQPPLSRTPPSRSPPSTTPSSPSRPLLVESMLAIDDNQHEDDELDLDESARGGRAVLAQGNHIGVAREGWLSVGDPKDKSSWKKRYAVLAGPTFTYFASKGAGDALESLWVTNVSLSSSRPNALDLKTDSGRMIGIGADSREDLVEWERALSAVLGTPALLRAASSKGETDLDDVFSDPVQGGRRPSSYAGVFREGWLLTKQGLGKADWVRHYFVLNGATLEERDTPTSKATFQSLVVRMTVNNDSSAGEFEIELMSGRSLRLRAENAVDAEAWIHALSDLVGTPVSKPSPPPTPAPKRVNLPSPVIRPPVNLSPPKVRKTGWLTKEGGLIKTWKRRYFILDGDALHYFDKINGNVLGGGIVFRVVHNTATANSLDVHFLNGRILRISTETRADIDAWFDALRAAADTSVHKVNRAQDSAGGANDAPGIPVESGQRGWLLKRGQMMKTWKKRYFVIQRNRITYYDGVGGELLGSGAVFDVTPGNQRPLSLDIRFQNGRLLHIAAADDEDYKQWHEALKGASNISESFLSQGSHSQEEPLFGKDFDYDINDEGVAVDEDEDILFESDREEDESSGYGLWEAAMNNKPDMSREDSWDSDLSESNHDGSESDGGGSVSLEHRRRNSETASIPDEPRGCSGWLRKEGEKRKTWKRRYFTLQGTTLKYFKSDKGSFLRSYEVTQVEETPAIKFGLTIVMKGGRRLAVAAESNDEYEMWLLALWGVLADRRASLSHGGDEGHYSAVGVINVKSVPTSPAGQGSAPIASKAYSGWLEKEGRRFKTWKRRYFTVKNGALMYFNDIGGETQGHGTVRGVAIDKTKPNTLRLMLGKDRVMRVTAATEAEMNTWYQVLSVSQKSPRGSSPVSEIADDFSEVASSLGSAALDRRSLGSAPSSPVSQPTRSRLNEEDYLKNDTITNESFLRIRGPGEDLSLTGGSFYKPRSFKGDLPFQSKLAAATESDETDSTQLSRINSDEDLEYLKGSNVDRELMEAMRKKKENEVLPPKCASCCVVM